jgi:hypothetical protein
MNTWILPTALQQDVKAVPSPRLCKGRLDDGTAMALSAELRMSGDIIKVGMATTSAQEVRSRDEHARCSDPGADI